MESPSLFLAALVMVGIANAAAPARSPTLRAESFFADGALANRRGAPRCVGFIAMTRGPGSSARTALFADPGDPPRWYEPQSRYDNAMHEARERYRADVEYVQKFRESPRLAG